MTIKKVTLALRNYKKLDLINRTVLWKELGIHVTCLHSGLRFVSVIRAFFQHHGQWQSPGELTLYLLHPCWQTPCSAALQDNCIATMRQKLTLFSHQGFLLSLLESTLCLWFLGSSVRVAVRHCSRWWSWCEVSLRGGWFGELKPITRRGENFQNDEWFCAYWARTCDWADWEVGGLTGRLNVGLWEWMLNESAVARFHLILPLISREAGLKAALRHFYPDSSIFEPLQSEYANYVGSDPVKKQITVIRGVFLQMWTFRLQNTQLESSHSTLTRCVINSLINHLNGFNQSPSASINIQSDRFQIPPPWLAGDTMGNYSEERTIFGPVAITQSLQICEKENETRGKMGGGGGGGRKSNKEEKRWKGISLGGGGDLQCSFRFNKGSCSFTIVSVFSSSFRGRSAVRLASTDFSCKSEWILEENI